jgi:quinol-cytochrome oxidoreductase complex cytochrome b subunit
MKLYNFLIIFLFITAELSPMSSGQPQEQSACYRKLQIAAGVTAAAFGIMGTVVAAEKANLFLEASDVPLRAAYLYLPIVATLPFVAYAKISHTIKESYEQSRKEEERIRKLRQQFCDLRYTPGIRIIKPREKRDLH